MCQQLAPEPAHLPQHLTTPRDRSHLYSTSAHGHGQHCPGSSFAQRRPLSNPECDGRSTRTKQQSLHAQRVPKQPQECGTSCQSCRSSPRTAAPGEPWHTANPSSQPQPAPQKIVSGQGTSKGPPGLEWAVREAQPAPPARRNSSLTRQILLHIQAVFCNSHTVFAPRMLLSTQGQQRKSLCMPPSRSIFLGYRKVSLPVAGGWNWMSFIVPSNPSMILHSTVTHSAGKPRTGSC